MAVDRARAKTAALKALRFLSRRTITLVALGVLLSHWLVDFDRMKLKALNRVVPGSMEDLVVFARDPQPDRKAIVGKYVLYFKTAANILPKAAAAQGMLGYCSYYLGDRDKALWHYRKAVVLNPDFFWFYYNLGVIYLEQGLYRQATLVLEKAIASSPENALVFMHASKIYITLTKYAADLKYDLDRNLFGGYRDAYDMLALCYYNLKEYDKILYILEKSIRLKLHDRAFLYDYGDLSRFARTKYLVRIF